MKYLRIVIMALAVFTFSSAQSQVVEPYVRIARLVIDSTQIDPYLSFLKEEIDIAVNIEKGVLRMYAVQDKMDPCRITIFETYRNKAAYEAHIETPHFKKYKSGTATMVKSLELIDVVPIIFKAKKNQ